MKAEYDLKKMKKRPGKVKIDPAPKIMISIRLEASVLASLKDEAEKLGIGYQTLISALLKTHVAPENESFEERIIDRIMKKLEKAGIRPESKKRKIS